ncbi:MAG: hypothetical protein VYE22_41190 [Myxococcota bacterium]|nr:hypothetical protein [Myxococcota bacterium]
MSALAREFFLHNPAIVGPLIAMAIFVLVFGLAAWRAFRANAEHVDHMGRLPLDEEEVSHG